jgi:hypothetical protein
MPLRTEAGMRTLPVPDYPELRIDTLCSIIRQSEPPREAIEG